jgi:hypothetical protein
VGTKLMCIVGLATLSGSSLGAQDISGDWQGALKADKDLRQSKKGAIFWTPAILVLDAPTARQSFFVPLQTVKVRRPHRGPQFGFVCTG